MQIQKTTSTNTNESSVLFSLATLGAMAQPLAAAKPSAKEELIAIGATPSPVLAAPIVTPPIVQPAASSTTRAWIAGALVIAAVILGGSYVAGRAMQRPVVVVRAAPRVEGSVNESETVSESESESESESVSVSTSTTTSTTTSTSTPHPRPHRETVVVTPAPPAPAPHERTLEELLAAPLCCGHTTTQTPPPPAPALAATPSRDDVMSAMRAVSVSECGPEHGIANVRVTVASTGRISSAVVSGPLAGTSAGSCVARAVRSASFPRFAQSSFVFSYPFRI